MLYYTWSDLNLELLEKITRIIGKNIYNMLLRNVNFAEVQPSVPKMRIN